MVACFFFFFLGVSVCGVCDGSAPIRQCRSCWGSWCWRRYRLAAARLCGAASSRLSCPGRAPPRSCESSSWERNLEWLQDRGEKGGQQAESSGGPKRTPSGAPANTTRALGQTYVFKHHHATTQRHPTLSTLTVRPRHIQG